MTRLEGKVAIVTGAGMGQGRATALRFAREGAKVVATDLSGAEMETAAEIPDSIDAIRADMTNTADVARLVAETVELHGRLDVLCNVVGLAAGIAQGPIPGIDEDQWDFLMAVNVKSVFLGMKHAIPAMVTTGGGAIVNWSSIAALQARPGGASYAATKAAILSLTRTAAVEWGKDNIRANAICPGVVYPTGMTLAGEQRAPERFHEAAARAPLGRTAHPDEIAGIAVFLASDEAEFMTGGYIVADGGTVAGGAS